LNELQDIHWTPVHNWVNEKFGVKLKTTESIIGSKQSKEVAEPLLKIMMGFDPLTLAGNLV
jgi:ATP synthase F1 complex assembly factor 2